MNLCLKRRAPPGRANPAPLSLPDNRLQLDHEILTFVRLSHIVPNHQKTIYSGNRIPNHRNRQKKAIQSQVTTSRTLIFVFFLFLVIATQRLHMILCRRCHIDHSASISKGKLPALPLIAGKVRPKGIKESATPERRYIFCNR